MSFYALIIALLIPATVIVTGIASKGPKNLWPLLIVISVATAGIAINGYTIVDEYLTFCLLLGIFMFISLGFKLPSPPSPDRLERFHQIIFLILIIYLIAETFRGIIEMESIRKIRWVIFFGMVWGVSVIYRRIRYDSVSRHTVLITFTISLLCYLSFYLFHGIFSEMFRGVSRWDLQTYEWGTTAYTLFPLVVALPAVFSIIRDGHKNIRYLGWATLVLSLSASLYYDSRSALVAVLGLGVLTFPVLGIKRLTGALLLSCLIFYMFLSFIWLGERDLDDMINDIVLSGSAIWQDSEGAAVAGPGRDIDRWLHIQVAFTALTENWMTLLFGHGYRASGMAISTHLYDLYRGVFLPDKAMYVRDDESTEAFTAFLVDTGLIGYMLLLLNFLCVGLQILREKNNPYRLVLLGSLGLLLFWMVIINILDVTLFFIAIMPSGLLVLLAKTMRSHTRPAERKPGLKPVEAG